jgi:hypothetical protein
VSPRDEDGREESGREESGPVQAGQPASDREAHVSRLLAAAERPEDARMPRSVAERLDAVLADLVTERAAGEPHAQDASRPGAGSAAAPSPEAPAGPEAGTGPVPPEEVTGVTELASRRRRWGPRLLVAAASVSVLALGVGVAVDDLTGSGGEGAMSSGAGASQQERGADAQDRAEAPGPAEDGGPGIQSGRSLDAVGAPARLRTASLRADLQRVEDVGVAEPVSSDPRRWREACVRPATGAGDEWAPVRLDGEPGVVVLRAPAGGRRTAEVFACGRPGSPVASTTVEAR